MSNEEHCLRNDISWRLTITDIALYTTPFIPGIGGRTMKIPSQKRIIGFAGANGASHWAWYIFGSEIVSE
jgi:hypothetical protein